MTASFKGKVACTPITENSVKTEKVGGLRGIVNKTRVEGLKVVFGLSEANLRPGDTVYVKGNSFTAGWAKDVFTLDGREFIMVPVDQIELVDRVPLAPPPRPAPTSLPGDEVAKRDEAVRRVET